MSRHGLASSTPTTLLFRKGHTQKVILTKQKEGSRPLCLVFGAKLAVVSPAEGTLIVDAIILPTGTTLPKIVEGLPLLLNISREIWETTY